MVLKALSLNVSQKGDVREGWARGMSTFFNLLRDLGLETTKLRIESIRQEEEMYSPT